MDNGAALFVGVLAGILLSAMVIAVLLVASIITIDLGPPTSEATLAEGLRKAIGDESIAFAVTCESTGPVNRECTVSSADGPVRTFDVIVNADNCFRATETLGDPPDPILPKPESGSQQVFVISQCL